MKFLLLTALLVSSSVFGAGFIEVRTDFSIYSTSGSEGRVHYNCDSAEDNVEDLLVAMGAKKIDVWCSGRISKSLTRHYPLYITASFEAPSNRVRGNDNFNVEYVTFTKSEKCHFYKTAFNLLRKNFMISSIQMSTCAEPSDPIKITFNALKK